MKDALMNLLPFKKTFIPHKKYNHIHNYTSITKNTLIHIYI